MKTQLFFFLCDIPFVMRLTLRRRYGLDLLQYEQDIGQVFGAFYNILLVVFCLFRKLPSC